MKFSKEETVLFEQKFLGEEWKTIFPRYNEVVRKLSDGEIRKRYSTWLTNKQPVKGDIPLTEIAQMTEEQLFERYNMDMDTYYIKHQRVTEAESGNAYFQIMFMRKSLDDVKIEVNFETIPKCTKKFKEDKNLESDLSILTLFDVHLGKRADLFTSGEHANLDTELDKLTDIFIKANALIPTGSTLILPIGQDLFNADNHFGTTTKGTPQKNDAHMLEVFKRAMPIFINFIDTLVERNINVKLLYSMGNHDTMISGAFHLALVNYYVNHSLVDNITDDLSPRQYFHKNKYSCVFLHGDNRDFKNIHQIFTIEKPEYWSNSALRDCFSGHTHGLQTKENFGLTVHVAQSPSAGDEWHYTNGYIGNARACQLHAINTKDGTRTAIYNINV